PAPAQGALAVEVAAHALRGADGPAPDGGDGPAPDGGADAGTSADARAGADGRAEADALPICAARLAAVDDRATRAAVTAERALLRTLEAGCSAPVAAFAQIEDGALRLRALTIRPDGTRVVESESSAPFDVTADAASGEGSVPMVLGADPPATLLEGGAGGILAEAKACVMRCRKRRTCGERRACRGHRTSQPRRTCGEPSLRGAPPPTRTGRTVGRSWWPARPGVARSWWNGSRPTGSSSSTARSCNWSSPSPPSCATI